MTYPCTKIVTDEWFESAYDLLQIVHLPDGKAVKAADQIQYCGGVGSYGLGSIAWSPNSRYFYYTDAAYGVPDGAGPEWHRPVYRFDTQTGKTETAGGPFSPDAEKIAVVQYEEGSWRNPKRLLVQTLNGDMLASYPFESVEQGCSGGWSSDIGWSPDNRQIVYLESACDQAVCSSTLYRIDLEKNARQQIFSGQQPAFAALAWTETDRLTLTGRDYSTWYYTLSTGKLERKGK